MNNLKLMESLVTSGSGESTADFISKGTTLLWSSPYNRKSRTSLRWFQSRNFKEAYHLIDLKCYSIVTCDNTFAKMSLNLFQQMFKMSYCISSFIICVLGVQFKQFYYLAWRKRKKKYSRDCTDLALYYSQIFIELTKCASVVVNTKQ